MLYLPLNFRESDRMSEKDFEYIFKRYYSDIYNFIYHYVMNQDDAKDLAQDVFIGFFEKYRMLREDTDPKQYLLTMAKNRCISFFRHRNVLDRNSLKFFETLIFSARSEYDTTYDDLFLQLNVAMDQLSDLQKRVVELKLAGKNYTEMSEQLGVSPSQVHRHIKKAYNKIRKEVGSRLSDTQINLILFVCLTAGWADRTRTSCLQSAVRKEDYSNF